MSKSKVIVVGASGYIGKATLASLVSRHSESLEVSAGVRSPDKCEKTDKVTFVKADMGDKTGLATTLKDYETVFLVIPGHEKRTDLGMNGLEAAKEAGIIKSVVLLSVLTSGTDTILGNNLIHSKPK